MNPSNHILTLEDLHRKELLDPDRGATVTKLQSFPHTIMLLEVARLSPHFIQAASETLESNYSFKCLSPREDNAWTIFSKVLANTLNEILPAELEIEEPIAFDDLYLTSYPHSPYHGALGVGPHRDTNCKSIVATLILTGELPFFICKDKERSESVEIHVRIGELLLMRADRCGTLPKPLHYVGEIQAAATIQFGMRQYIDPHYKDKK